VRARCVRNAPHALISLEDLRYELALSGSGHLQALDLARGGNEVALAVAVTLSSPGGVELPMAGLRMLDHLLFKHLLQDDLDTMAHSGFDIHLGPEHSKWAP
jgi:hypothetical protein